MNEGAHISETQLRGNLSCALMGTGRGSHVGLEVALVKALRLSAGTKPRPSPDDSEPALGSPETVSAPYASSGAFTEISRRMDNSATRQKKQTRADSRVGLLSSLSRGSGKASPESCARQTRESVEEMMASSYGMLNGELAREIVLRIHGSSPSFFERLIIDLLLRMGYGGGRIEMGRTLGGVGDGGVDGVIKEDELGLDVLYVQAKRLDPANPVPVREVRDFVGGLDGHRATKGVFVTTSYFPASAYDFVTRVSKRVVLIDGRELATLMIRHRVGVRVKSVYELKKVDEEYFVE